MRYTTFVDTHGHDLIASAYLLTGDRAAAEHLAAQALRSIAPAWPAPAPLLQTRLALYQGYMRAEGADERRAATVACRRDGLPAEVVAELLGITPAAVDAHLAADLVLAVPDAVISAPGLAKRVMRSVRLRRALLPGALAAIAVLAIAFPQAAPPAEPWARPGQRAALVQLNADGTVGANGWLGDSHFRTATNASGEVVVTFTPTPPLAPVAWENPRTHHPIRYAVPDRCGPAQTTPVAGTITCVGWTLHLEAKHNTHSTGEHAHFCSNDLCWSDARIPDAATTISEGDGSYAGVQIAISPDGRRVAYLSAAERRYLAVDMRDKTRRYLTPVLSPEQLAGRSRVTVSADGRYFTVRQGESLLRTDFTTGSADTPAVQQVRDGWMNSPNGTRSAMIDGERGRNGTLDILNSRTGKVLARHPLPGFLAASTSDLDSWVDDEEVAILMRDAASRDLLGWFRVHTTTGKLTRIPRVPDTSDIVLGLTVTARTSSR